MKFMPYLILVLALFVSHLTQAQNIKLYPEDSVFVDINGGRVYLLHQVKHKQTLYSMKNFYQIKLADLYYCNPGLSKRSLKVGEKLRIPISAKAILRNKPRPYIDSNYVKVYYQVKANETLWRVARKHFNMPVELLQNRNQLSSAVLYEGQRLQVGWFSLKGVSDSLSKHTGLDGALAEENRKWRKKYEMGLMRGKTEKMEEGRACWPKYEQLSQQTNGLYVLYDGAQTGDVILIENPMIERRIYAKVLGPVPDTPFARGSIVMLSPISAQALGILDAQAYVKIRKLVK
ncbi:LysM domain-containing protein [Saprospira grandis DSM 2844]|uniref:LysM domain-containing protein n=2 Tax=Saprospira TaxID=1007 RepID=J1I0V9_9BACT|nr:LysM domain-containing protein [Saprospira grandis DSM 2844]